jgi:hypothetical protein
MRGVLVKNMLMIHFDEFTSNANHKDKTNESDAKGVI